MSDHEGWNALANRFIETLRSQNLSIEASKFQSILDDCSIHDRMMFNFIDAISYMLKRKDLTTKIRSEAEAIFAHPYIRNMDLYAKEAYKPVFALADEVAAIGRKDWKNRTVEIINSSSSSTEILMALRVHLKSITGWRTPIPIRKKAKELLSWIDQSLK
jgi:hypothetical protein